MREDEAGDGKDDELSCLIRRRLASAAGKVRLEVDSIGKLMHTKKRDL